MAAAEASLVIVIFGVAFGCSIKVKLAFGRGWGTVIIRPRKKIKMVAFEVIIYVVFEIVIIVVVVNCESLTLNPVVKIIIFGVIDEAKGPIILRRISVVVVGIINVVFGIVIAVVIVDCEGPRFSSPTLHPSVRIIIACVDKAKSPIIGGGRGLDTVGTVIID